MNSIPQRFTANDGAEIAEAAMVLPLVFMLLLGIVWFGRAFNIYSTIQQAAQQGAITAARAPCATCSGGDSTPSMTAAANVVIALLQASSLDPTQIVANPTPAACATSTDNITICQGVLLNPPSTPTVPQACSPPPTSSQPPICGVLVTFQYPFAFNLPFTSLNLQTVTMTAEAQSRMEN
jgi:Flp pilus assembly protein TadG